MAVNTRKVCMLGDFGVGKTSLVARFVHSVFAEKYQTTVGAKVDTKQVDLGGGDGVKLVIWDLAGGAEVTPQVKTYLRGVTGYLLVVDGTRANTLEAARGLKEAADTLIPGRPAVVLINKNDLRESWELGEADIDSLRADGFMVFETSAKTGESVEDAFAELARSVN